MRIIARNTLALYWERYPEARQPLADWLRRARHADWSGMADVKAAYPKASVINRERVVFDICGGNYRMVAAFDFPHAAISSSVRMANTIVSIRRPSAGIDGQRDCGEYVSVSSSLPLIRNDPGHAAALVEIERLWGAEVGTLEGDRLDALITAIDAYENRRWPIPDTGEREPASDSVRAAT